MKVICIDDSFCKTKFKIQGLTKNKEYEVKQSDEYDNYYELKDDLGNVNTYKKSRFKLLEVEKVEDKIIKIRCINEKCKACIDKECIRKHIVNGDCECNCRIKPVEKENKPKEYSAMELLDFEIGTKFKDKDGCLVEIAKIEDTANDKKIIFSDDYEEETLGITTIWARMKFTKVEPKPVSLIEAWKALEEGKIIESVITGYKYRKHISEGYLMILTQTMEKENRTFNRFTYMRSEELEGQWIILE